MTDLSKEAYDAFYALVHGRLPLNLFRDRVYMSPEAWAMFRNWVDLQSVILPDSRLEGVEMRLEWRAA